MKKEILWTSTVSSVIGVLNMIVFIVLSCLKIVEANFLSYMFLLGFFVTAWIPLILNLIFKTTFNLFILLCYQIFLMLSLLVGSLWHVYRYFDAYDMIVHFGSGVLITFIAYMFFSNNKQNRFSLFWLFLLVFSISMMCGSVWEIWEFTTDAIFNNDSQVSAGLIGRAALMDTMTDIICDFVGGILGGIAVVIMEKRNRKKQEIVVLENSKGEEKEKI